MDNTTNTPNVDETTNTPNANETEETNVNETTNTTNVNETEETNVDATQKKGTSDEMIHMIFSMNKNEDYFSFKIKDNDFSIHVNLSICYIKNTQTMIVNIGTTSFLTKLGMITKDGDLIPDAKEGLLQLLGSKTHTETLEHVMCIGGGDGLNVYNKAYVESILDGEKIREMIHIMDFACTENLLEFFLKNNRIYICDTATDALNTRSSKDNLDVITEEQIETIMEKYRKLNLKK